MYHNIGYDGGLYTIKPEVFAKQMDLVCGRDDVLVTFDDGYRDWLKYAFPILKERSIKAIFFIAAGFIDKEIEGLCALREEDIRQLALSGMEIGSHGVTHKPLNTFNTLEFEAVTSREILSCIINKEIRYFSFPKGVMIKNLCAHKRIGMLGYDKIFTSIPGFWDRKSFFVPRFVIRKTDSLAIFKGIINKHMTMFLGRMLEYGVLYSLKNIFLGEDLYLKVKRFLWK